MNWYTGDISQAILDSKQKNAFFVVFIEGTDDKSKHFKQLINTQDVAETLGCLHFVAVTIIANSLKHQQFAQFYRNPPVPSIYFIGDEGKAVAIITEVQDSHSLLDKIYDVLEKKVGGSIKRKQRSQDFIKNEQLSGEGASSSVSCENGVCTKKKDSPDEEKSEEIEGQVNDDKPDLSPEEKVERAKQIIEMKREEKRKEEEEEERKKEIERRKMGQNVQQLKRWQDDQELKQLMEDREREKRESKAARDRVLAQIAQDKAERASKFGGGSSPPPASASPDNQSKSSPPKNNLKLDTSVRLQFKVPDGKSVTQDFEHDDTLLDVHEFIDENISLPFNPYKLSTTFPRREFTEEDKSKTLTELELVPTAVLLILPVIGSSSGNSSSSSLTNVGILSLLWALARPIFSVLGFMKSLIMGRRVPTQNTTSQKADNKKRTAETSNENKNQIKRRAGETTVIKRQGNIARLSNKTDSDEENNTWNGNSTQQM